MYLVCGNRGWRKGCGAFFGNDGGLRRLCRVDRRRLSVDDGWDTESRKRRGVCPAMDVAGGGRKLNMGGRLCGD